MPEEKDICSSPGTQEMFTSQARVVTRICAALMVLATVAVVSRLISRKLSTAPFWWDDALSVISLAISYACFTISFVEAKHGVGRHSDTVSLKSVHLLVKVRFTTLKNLLKLTMSSLQMTVAYQILYNICITLVKISILLFYRRIFGTTKQFRTSVYVLIACACLWCIAVEISTISYCVPVVPTWQSRKPSKCFNDRTALLGSSITNVLIDFAILILPLSPIWSLALTVRQKTQLTAIFLLGGLQVPHNRDS